MEPNQKKIIKFEDVRQDILDALNKRRVKIKIEEPVSLLDGFVNEPVGKELSTSFTVGGPTVPMIMLLGKESGQIYLFALKAILPDLGL
jgi:hypothetical protein